MKYWEVKAKAEGKVGELLLYGDISNAQMWGDEITPLQIDADLKALGDIDTLNIYINSGGGNVFAGQAIYSILKRHKAFKNAYVDGLAASISSLIPMACNKVYIPSNAMMMMHKPWGGVVGNADDMRKRADAFDKIEDVMVNAYEEKSKMDREKIKALLTAETWLNAKEAVELGFADEMQEEIKIAASIDGDFLVFGDVKIDTARFYNLISAKEKLEPYREAKKEPEPVAIKLQEQNKEFSRIKNKLLGGI